MYWLAVRRQRRAAASELGGAGRGARRGPVPGYSYMPASLIRWDPSEPPIGLDDSWQAESIETLHSARRSRVVLSIRAANLTHTEHFSLMKTLAQRLQRRTNADVITVQLLGATADSEPEGMLVYAPDGRGWTGTAQEAVLTASLPDREAFRMAV
jgi:hypothetical protein